MATYRQIQDYVRSKHGWVPKTCWIADCKEEAGLSPQKAPNRFTDERKHPCPVDKKKAIFEAFSHFGMV